jgi:hypothetical protein
MGYYDWTECFMHLARISFGNNLIPCIRLRDPDFQLAEAPCRSVPMSGG